MKDPEQNQSRPEFKRTLFMLYIFSFCFATLIVMPLSVVLRLVEALGVLCVGLGAGLLAYSIIGLYTSKGGSIGMWGLLILSIAIPILYFKVQFSSDAIIDERTGDVADATHQFLSKKLGIDALHDASTESDDDQDHA